MASTSDAPSKTTTPLEVEMWSVVDRAISVVPTEVGDVDTDAMRLCMLLRGASNIMFGDLQATIREQTSLIPASMNVLLIVIVNGELEFTTLAKYASLPKATASALVESMVNDGILARRVPSTDRRVTLLSATDAGRELFRASFATYNKREVFWTSALDTSEQSMLVGLLKKLIESRFEDSVYAHSR